MCEKWAKRERILVTGFLIIVLLATGITVHAKTTTEKDWPRQIEVPQGTIIIYQPQLEMFNGVQLKGRCAIAVTPKGADRPSWGAFWFDARLLVDRDQRQASILECKITRARFTGSRPEQEKKLTAFIEDEVPKWSLSISMDRLTTGLQRADREIMAQDRLEQAPPRIIVSEEPAALILINGEARMIKIEDSNLLRVANSPFQIIFNPEDQTYYLNGGSVWFATQNLRSDWQPVEQGPEELTKFYTFWTRPQATASPTAGQKDDKPPRLIVPFEPAELILFDGPPQYQPVAGTDLFYAVNTGSDVFLDGKSQQVFVLLAGRWYQANSLAGPWQFVASDILPDSFKKIPSDSPKRNVLAHVAGTELAQEAFLDTQIPQTAVISRRINTLQVTYDGEPEFKPIEGLRMQYAANTDSAVISTNDRFYCCQDAIWYEAEKPQGPWTICVAVPDTIYSMPPSCPLYNVKFVRIYQVTPETVQEGYTPGYVGCYQSSSGTIVYGTGYRYPEWFRAQYIARPITWGVRARYNPLTGAWGLFADYVSSGGKYRIIPGSVDGGGHRITKWSVAGWWGAGGYRDYQDMAGKVRGSDGVQIRNEDRAKHNIYAKYQSTAEAEALQRHVENIRFMEIKEAIVPKANPNNVFVDRLGDVYRRTDSGWQKRQGTAWIDVRTGVGENQSQLNDDYRKRQRGAERDRQYEAAGK